MIENISHMRAGAIKGISSDAFDQFSVEFGDQLTKTPGAAPAQTMPDGSSFGDMVNQALGEIGRLEEDAAQKTFDFATGKPVDIHQMMIASAKADVTLQLASAVISKTAQGVNTLMQTQV